MSDLINREDAIQAKNEFRNINCETYDDFQSGYAQGWNDCNKQFIRNLEEIPSKPQWIPCSERLPKESDGQVLVTRNGYVGTATHSEFSNTWYHGDFMGVGGDDPIAWMPLPEPYNADMEGEWMYTGCDECVHKSDEGCINLICLECMHEYDVHTQEENHEIDLIGFPKFDHFEKSEGE